jgi:hypothetical protein
MTQKTSTVATPGDFGRRNIPANEETAKMSALLTRRLREKIENYERIAVDLQSSGESDAACVLVRAAQRLRHIAPGA